ncbi:hypothetical protein AGLY_009841 [Aphis glycines]|uniref:Uncharacterized protein n=1 Tax=Aphis glycines TaxID=307491 RepID=A0A6G0TH61_APHGL|nr:hypothetical protein AGLY_009841 [Aphis glycines]
MMITNTTRYSGNLHRSHVYEKWAFLRINQIVLLILNKNQYNIELFSIPLEIRLNDIVYRWKIRSRILEFAVATLFWTDRTVPLRLTFSYFHYGVVTLYNYRAQCKIFVRINTNFDDTFIPSRFDTRLSFSVDRLHPSKMIPKISNVKQWAKNEIIFKRKYYLIIFGGKEDLNAKTISVNQNTNNELLCAMQV